MSDFYQTLGVAPNATPDEIKSAYRKLAKSYHPDVNANNPAAEEMFKRINEAYDTLKDPQKKAAYDYERANVRRGPYRTHMGGGFTRSSHYNPYDSIYDDLEAMLRRASGRAYGFEQQKNKSINLTYKLTLEEVFNGKTTTLTYSAEGGPRQTVQITIPRSVEHGNRMRIQGKGDNSIPNAPPGDLIITFVVEPHSQFIRSGYNLGSAVRIDYIDAILGTKRAGTSICGTPIDIVVPPNTIPGDKLRIEGKGLYKPDGTRGDLFVELYIEPPKLNSEQLELLRQIKSG